MADHDCNGRVNSGFVLAAFQGSLDRYIRAAIASKTVTADMVAQAGQVSHRWDLSAARSRQIWWRRLDRYRTGGTLVLTGHGRHGGAGWANLAQVGL